MEIPLYITVDDSQDTYFLQLDYHSLHFYFTGALTLHTCVLGFIIRLATLKPSPPLVIEKDVCDDSDCIKENTEYTKADTDYIKSDTEKFQTEINYSEANIPESVSLVNIEKKAIKKRTKAICDSYAFIFNPHYFLLHVNCVLYCFGQSFF